MFKCDICNKTTKSGEKQNKKIVKTRKITYYNRDKYGREIKSEGDGL